MSTEEDREGDELLFNRALLIFITLWLTSGCAQKLIRNIGEPVHKINSKYERGRKVEDDTIKNQSLVTKLIDQGTSSYLQVRVNDLCKRREVITMIDKTTFKSSYQSAILPTLITLGELTIGGVVFAESSGFSDTPNVNSNGEETLSNMQIGYLFGTMMIAAGVYDLVTTSQELKSTYKLNQKVIEKNRLKYGEWKSDDCNQEELKNQKIRISLEEITLDIETDNQGRVEKPIELLVKKALLERDKQISNLESFVQDPKGWSEKNLSNIFGDDTPLLSKIYFDQMKVLAVNFGWLKASLPLNDKSLRTISSLKNKAFGINSTRMSNLTQKLFEERRFEHLAAISKSCLTLYPSNESCNKYRNLGLCKQIDTDVKNTPESNLEEINNINLSKVDQESKICLNKVKKKLEILVAERMKEAIAQEKRELALSEMRYYVNDSSIWHGEPTSQVVGSIACYVQGRKRRLRIPKWSSMQVKSVQDRFCKTVMPEALAYGSRSMFFDITDGYCSQYYPRRCWVDTVDNGREWFHVELEDCFDAIREFCRLRIR